LLEVKDLQISIGGNAIIRSLSFNAREGSVVIVKGRNGSGKTTLLRAIAGIIPSLFTAYEVKGTIKIRGIRTQDAVRMGWIAYIPQDPYLSLITSRVSDEEIFLKASPLYKELSPFIEKVKHKQIFDLSAGELYRLLILSAINRNTRLLIIDEPSSYLDPDILEEFIDTIKKYTYKEGLIVVIAESENTELDRYTDMIINLNDHSDTFMNSAMGSIDRSSILSISSIINSNCCKCLEKAPEIILKEVHYIKDKAHILKSISIQLHGSVIACLVGNNGSGKTTLLKTLAGIIKPSSGNIYVKGKIFYIPQLPIKWFTSSTVKDEIVTYMKNAGRTCCSSYIDSILNMFRLDYLAYRNPYSLSVGESRRLSAALAYISMPDVLLFDEPFLGADEETHNIILSTLKHLKICGSIVVIATHKFRSTRLDQLCDLIINMKDGMVIGGDTK